MRHRLPQGRWNMTNPLSFAVLALAAICGGCGNANPGTATQVAAKVNADEVTVHQINNILTGNRDLAPEAAAEAKRQILERLINQQLAQQQAIDRKLDRSPRVMQAIEAAKSEILARAYFEKVAAAQPEPTAAEVKAYYAEHPELFSERRVFTLEEIVIVPQPGLEAGLRERMGSTRSMARIAAWLGSREAKFTEYNGTRAAEEIPLDILPQLHAMAPGEMRVIEGGGRLNVFKLLAVRSEPVDEATAAPHINRMLANLRAAEGLARDLAQLRAQSKIEYFGEFSKSPAVQQAKATEPPANDARGQEGQAAAPNFAKGVRGLR